MDLGKCQSREPALSLSCIFGWGPSKVQYWIGKQLSCEVLYNYLTNFFFERFFSYLIKKKNEFIIVFSKKDIHLPPFYNRARGRHFLDLLIFMQY